MKKKLCVVMSTHWSWVLGGAEYQVSLIMKELVTNKDVNVTFITRNVDPTFSPNGYNIKKIKSSGFFSRYSKTFDVQSLLSALNDEKPDIIYQRAGSAYTGICAWYAKKKKIPMVWHVSHDMDVDPKECVKKSILNSLEKLFIRYGIRHSTNIIVQTDNQAALLKKNYEIKANHIIRNFHPLPAQNCNKGNKIKIVWVANFKPMKQPEIFVRLAKELENIIDAQFIMIGRNGNKSRYNELIKTIKTIKSLKYIGEKSQEEVNHIFLESHLLINTSKLEGFSNTFIQAWMREIPVLTLTVDPDEVIRKNKIGICAGNYETLKKSIIELINSPELISKMGKQGKNYANKHHSMKNIIKIMEVLNNPSL
jgi:glycosyltransferase involved in cell wall biosynthesis